MAAKLVRMQRVEGAVGLGYWKHTQRDFQRGTTKGNKWTQAATGHWAVVVVVGHHVLCMIAPLTMCGVRYIPLPTPGQAAHCTSMSAPILAGPLSILLALDLVIAFWVNGLHVDLRILLPSRRWFVLFHQILHMGFVVSAPFCFGALMLLLKFRQVSQ